MSQRVTRRRLLGTAAGAAAGGAFAGGLLVGKEASSDDTPLVERVVPFYGPVQAGIATPAQDRLHFAAFDVTADRVSDVRDLMRAWTDAAARMTAGLDAGPPAPTELAPPVDTGEASGLPAANLTVTFGFGPSLFARDRFGLDASRPPELRELPGLPGDELDPDRSGGDICVQACSDDPQVAFHAVRNLARIGRGSVVMRWSQLGFGRTSTTSRSQSTPRNLMGFKDGTKNIRAEDVELMRRHVWVDTPGWMHGGTYMVTRRIRMLIEVWDRASLKDQEDTIGRLKESGAPIGGKNEMDPVNAAKLPVDAHVRLAEPAANGGERILRRGYSFTDGMDVDLGQLDAGLFFICFQRDPAKQFVEIQRRLGGMDALNEYIKHTGSAVFAVPPGVQRGGYVGEGLLT